MIKFRPNISSFDEAIKFEKIFNTLDEMFEHIVYEWNNFGLGVLLSKEDLSVTKSLGKDDRVGWKDYRYILTTRIGEELYDVPQCVAMCSIE